MEHFRKQRNITCIEVQPSLTTEVVHKYTRQRHCIHEAIQGRWARKAPSYSDDFSLRSLLTLRIILATRCIGRFSDVLTMKQVCNSFPLTFESQVFPFLLYLIFFP
jgi:hypothetical protein